MDNIGALSLIDGGVSDIEGLKDSAWMADVDVVVSTLIGRHPLVYEYLPNLGELVGEVIADPTVDVFVSGLDRLIAPFSGRLLDLEAQLEAANERFSSFCVDGEIPLGEGESLLEGSQLLGESFDEATRFGWCFVAGGMSIESRCSSEEQATIEAERIVSLFSCDRPGDYAECHVLDYSADRNGTLVAGFHNASEVDGL